jgi:hypothetical protein
LKDALDGLTSQDPLPRLTFRCLLLALETHNNTTVAVIVQTFLERIVLTRKPWNDPETWRGVVILVKRLLPGSNRYGIVCVWLADRRVDGRNACRALCRVPVPTLLVLLNNPQEAPLKNQFVQWLRLGTAPLPESLLKELKAGLGVSEEEPVAAVLEEAIDNKKRTADEAGIDTPDGIKEEIVVKTEPIGDGDDVEGEDQPDTKRSRHD